MQLRPQDIVVALKLCANPARKIALVPMSVDLGISLSNTHAAMKRIAKSGLLLIKDGYEVLGQRNLLEFIVHGLPYVWPGEIGPITRGLPTAHGAPPLREIIVHGENDILVWPDAEGKARGQSLKPLIPSAAAAARRDPKLYEFLALTDAIRIGRARERKLAAEMLEDRLIGHPKAAKAAKAARR
ncbi:MAG: hypothetical protein ABI972_08735 [Acidobacteriota bacterium]